MTCCSYREKSNVVHYHRAYPSHRFGDCPIGLILIFNRALVLVIATAIDAIAHRLILQVALAALIADGTVQRMVEEGHEIIEASLPVVITVVKEINVPRLPSLRGIMKSKSAAIPIWTVKELNVSTSTVGLPGSFTKVIKVFFPQRVCQGEIFQGALESQVDCLVDKLRDARLI